MPKGSTALQEKVNASIKDIQDTGLLKKYQKEANKLMFQDGSFYEKYGNYFITGTLITIALAAIGVLCGAILGSLLALMKLAKTRWLRW